MKKIVLISFVFICILILLYTTLIVFINLKSKTVIVSRLQKELGREVSIQKIKFLPLFGLEVGDLDIENLLYVKNIRIFFSWTNVWQKDLLIDYLWIYEPDITILRTKDNKIVFGDSPEGEAAHVYSASQMIGKVVEGLVPVKHKKKLGGGPAGEKSGVVIKNINMMDGRLKYSDNLMEKEVSFVLKALNLKADILSYPLKAQVSHLELDAVIDKSSLPLAGSKLFSKGWIDPLRLDMVKNFKFIDKRGETILDVNLNSKKNDMAVSGKVSLNNFMFKKEEEDFKAASMEDVLFNVLQMSGLNILADFSFQTKMNDFRVEKIFFSGDVGYNKEELLKAGKEAGLGATEGKPHKIEPPGALVLPQSLR
ncbi:MAG: DUF748 domain-containing protein [Candidatus Omnitrophica bacterium]|nr:DUF748 domain-containing protein [Candidatus Omnitrophota bacterium]